MVNIKNLIVNNIGKITLILFAFTLCAFVLASDILGCIGLVLFLFSFILFLFKRGSRIILSGLIGGSIGVIIILAVDLVVVFILKQESAGWGDSLGMFGFYILIPSAMLLGFMYGMERRFLGRNVLSFILTIPWIISMLLLFPRM